MRLEDAISISYGAPFAAGLPVDAVVCRLVARVFDEVTRCKRQTHTLTRSVFPLWYS